MYLPPSEQPTDRPAPAPRGSNLYSTAWPREPAELTTIYKSGINVCVLLRAVEPAIASFASQVLATQDLGCSLRVRASRPSLGGLLPPDLAAQGAERFLEDVAFWIEVYGDLFGVDQIGVRLCSLREAMCPRFHVDRVLARLVCTYHGPGTEWIDSVDVDRTRLGHRAGGVSDEESGLLCWPDAISRMPTYAVGLLKGEAWPGNEGRGAVHRSPATSAAQARRVLLTLESL